MERWSGHYRIAALELLIKTYPVLAIQLGFRQQFQRLYTLAAGLRYCGYRSGVKKDQ